MGDLSQLPQAISSLSEAGLAILKKIPVIGDYIKTKEFTEEREKAINDSYVNDYKILNDPISQIQFINSFDDQEERKAVIGHIIEVKAGRQKELNIINVLNRLYNNVRNKGNTPIDDNSIHQDWWLLWLEKTQLTSDPVKQNIYAKMLELESVHSDSISPRFIRIFADLAVSEIELFLSVLTYFTSAGVLIENIDQTVIDLPTPEFDKVKILYETGLVAASSGLGEYTEYKPQLLGKEKGVTIPYNNYTIIIWTLKDKMQVIHSCNLTQEGKMLRDIVGEKDDLSIIKSIAEKINKSLSCKVSIHHSLNNRVNPNSIIVYEP